LLAAVFAAALSVSGAARAQDAGIMVGAHAPGAAVELLDGKSVDLAQYIGKKPVVLEFWATWCPLCRQMEPSAQAARQQYGDRVTFISVGVSNSQTPAAQKKYADEKHIGGLFVFDRDGKAVAAYKAPHTSYLVVIDREGKVVYTGVGGEQNVGAAVAKALPSASGMMGPGMGRGGN
jgi:thiol-disulfide isomerase/thioredoxin